MASGGLSSPRASYILAELEDVDNVFAPIRTASRVKFTCFDVSRHYIVFGTTAGGVVILQHDSLNYLKTLAEKEGPVCQIALAPDENIIGFATIRGVALVMEHNSERGSAQPQRLQLSFEHRGSLVTCLQWNVSSSKLFIGDDKGKVSVINVSTSRTRNIFQVPTTTLMKLDSKVVQLDFAQDHLLVSTLTRCYLCDTNKEQYLTIGKKLRDGEYGACFYPGSRSVDPCTIYSARPGSRMWEVDIKGSVCCTHQFKSALAIKPEKLYTFRHEVSMDETTMEDAKPQATNFQKLILIWPSTEESPFVFAWSQQGAFVFDPKRADVILWSDDIKGIKEAKCHRGDIFIFYLNNKFEKYTLMTVEQGVCRLYQQGLAIHGAQLLLLKKSSLCLSRLNIHVPPSFMLDMLQKASEMGKSYLFSGLSSVLNSLGLSPDKLSQSSRSSSAMSEPVRLNTGIYVVNKFIREADDDAPSSVCLSRWRSASPVFRNSSRSPHSSPSRSSDRASNSPKSQRSAATLKDSNTKIRTSSLIQTPDSTDSGTSGRVSEMSDETQSSPSSKDMHNKSSWQSWTHPENSRNENELNSQEIKLNGENMLISTQSNSSNSYESNTEILKDHMNGCTKASTSCTNGDEFNNNGFNVNPSISLNLQDLSKQSNSNEKRVSFQNNVSITSDDNLASSKNGRESMADMNNHTGVTYSPQYECPESLFDEYRYSGYSLYGSMMMMPNLDMSVLFGSEADFQNIKESLANKIVSGKNILMKNLRGLEQRIMQDSKPELLDVKTKQSETALSASPISQSDADYEKSASEFHSIDRQFWSFLPVIDISNLLEATKNAWSLSRDISVISDSKSISIILENWVNSLHSAQIAVIQAVQGVLQSYQNPSSHSYKDDDTLRSTCSQITSQDSSPSENCEISDRLDQEDPSVSESKSYDDDKHADSSSLNAEISDSSTLRTESILGKLVNLDEFVFVYDPFSLSYDDHVMMSELAMMCFQLEIWGKINKVKEMLLFVLKSKDKFDDLPKCNGKKDQENSMCAMNGSSEIIKRPPTLKQSESAHSLHKAEAVAYSSSLSVQQKILGSQYSDPGHLNAIPNGEISVISEDSSFEWNCSPKFDDSKSASFLQNYFHLFDVQRLRELLNILNKPCIKTWNVMLSGVSLFTGADEFTKKLASEQIETAANCLERSCIGPILISHLLKVFKVNSARGIDLCLQRSYHITPLDVLYLSKSCYAHPKPFLEYISKVLDCLPEKQRPKVLDKLLHHTEVRLEWIYGIFNVEDKAPENLKCTCGWPRPGSHLYPWEHMQLLLHILSTTNDMDNKFFEFCFTNGFWPGYLLLAKKLKLTAIHRKLIIQLCDINLLSASDLGYLPLDEEEWKEFFLLFSQSMVTNDSMKCLSCGKLLSCSIEFSTKKTDSKSWNSSMQWEAISRVALMHLDSIKVLEILQGLELPTGAFSSAFYKALMMSFLINKQQSALTHRILTTMSSYLWSRKLQSMSPEARLVFQMEKEKPSLSSNLNQKVEDSVPAKSKQCYLEEPESHWGVRTCLSTTCKICKMPLTSHLSSSNSGLVVYRCGHSYHAACSTEGFCAICLNSHIDDG